MVGRKTTARITPRIQVTAKSEVPFVDRTINQLIKRFRTNDPFKIAEGLNILIRYADLGDGTRGFYYRVLRRRFIVIHSGLSETWQKVICAHELGHDRLHPGINRFWLDEQTFFQPGRFEKQANQFAVRLLCREEKMEGETVKEFLVRNGVPLEMEPYI